MFVPAMALSLLAVVTSVHRYNERQTSSLLTLVTLPFTFTTTTVRILALALIISVYPILWSTVLIAGLGAALLVLNLLCVRQRQLEEKQETSCLLMRLPALSLRALASIISPLGYNSDSQLNQTRVRGGLLILLNYFLVMLGLGVGLATSSYYYVPNIYQGITMSALDLKVKIPEMSLAVELSQGMDINVIVPSRELDLGSASDLVADLETDDNWDLIFSLALPSLAVILSLPLTLTRIALLGLDCLLVRKSQLGESLAGARRGLGGRLSLSLCCGVISAIVTSITLLAVVALVVLKLAPH